MDMTDAAVIAQVKEGNIDTFGILVEKYTAKIHHFVVQKLFDKEEADDIVQNSFIQFYKALGSFDVSKPVYPYLLQITRNELNMYYRKHHKTVPLNEDIIQSPERVQTEDTTNILQGLKKDYRKALVWFAEGYSYQEIAKRLGKPLNTVRTLIRRARLYVKKNISP
ncbi:MAG: sigma-70 family RNA polymerase sigma factor [bacterium]